MLRGAAILAVVAWAVTGCGGATRTVSITITATPTTTTAPPTATSGATRPSDEVLAVPAVGRFYATCPRAAHHWTLRFMVSAGGANDTISYRVRHGPMRRAAVKPGATATFQLAAGSFHTAEPADRIARHRATTIATTPPLDIRISQVTESQALRVDVHLALATIGGETGQCVLVGSRVDARTYLNGAP